MRSIAIIPARSGSKGLKDKNIMRLYGVPLIGYAIKSAIESNLFDEIMVSTDSESYAELARFLGAKVPFLRSKEKSSDIVSSWDVVIEVLEQYKKRGKEFETVCLLQPTSPLRKAEDIINGYKLLESKKADSVTSVCEVDHPPLWSMQLQENLSLNEFNKACEDVPRQQYGKYYRLNGAVYIRKIKYLEDKIQIENNDDYALIMNRRDSVDIDTIDDFELAEFYLKKQKNQDNL